MNYHIPLKTNDLREFGIPEPWSFGLADRTRFGELDVLNHINHTAYLRWFETFRIRYFAEYGISDYGPDAPRLVLRKISVDYLSEMDLGQDYVVTGRTVGFGKTSFQMEYAVWSESRCTATGHCVLVWLTQDGQKEPIPDHIKEVMRARDGAEQL